MLVDARHRAAAAVSPPPRAAARRLLRVPCVLATAGNQPSRSFTVPREGP